MTDPVLSPWPTSPAALTLATSTVKDEVDPGASNEHIQRLAAVAANRIEDYAPAAPQANKNLALFMYVGYLHEQESGAVRDKSIDLDSVKLSTSFVTNHARAFDLCGAKSILTRSKVRRAGTA